MGSGGHNRLTLEQIKELYENENREILECEVREVGKNKTKTTYVKYRCKIDEYKGWTDLGSLRRGSGCYKCSGKIKFSLDEVVEKLSNINKNIKILSKDYKNLKTKIKCECLIDEHIWYPRVGDLLNGHGCPVCSNKITHDGNRLSIVRPDLIKYFVNHQDTENYSISSGKKVQLKCPECGMLKTKLSMIYTLSQYGFSCDYCSDGISIPEKFGINLFKQLDVEFETQKIFDWSNGHRYDKYLLLNKEEYIYEIHGEQHYNYTGFKRSLEEEQENDLIKYNLAINNGIKPENYIVVDARCSSFEHLKDSYTKQLAYIFDLSNINWNKVWECCQESIVPKIWEAWENKNKDETTVTIGKMFGLNRDTVMRYLKRGNEIGKCVYDAKEEHRKNASRNGKNTKKTNIPIFCGFNIY